MPLILVIDDDEAMRDILRARLEDKYRVIATGDPEQAIALTLEHKPDAVLLDLLMPKFSGFEVCQTLNALSFTQKIPIFIMSGEPAPKHKSFCQNLGASEYFEKPIDFDVLRTRLAAAIGRATPERRTEARIRLHATLKLRGKDSSGRGFEAFVTTENVSVNGFLCVCTTELAKGADVDVFLFGDGEHFVGTANVVRTEMKSTPYPRYGFRFSKKPTDWVLQ